MAKFRIKIDATFNAENISDAFLKLEKHFEYLNDTDLPDPQIFDYGELDIHKEGD